ncbi:MAG: hypothetical protein V7638_2399 [Acidobacteriota bacterium]|jgi:hypothetical protein
MILTVSLILSPAFHHGHLACAYGFSRLVQMRHFSAPTNLVTVRPLIRKVQCADRVGSLRIDGPSKTRIAVLLKFIDASLLLSWYTMFSRVSKP